MGQPRVSMARLEGKVLDYFTKFDPIHRQLNSRSVSLPQSLFGSRRRSFGESEMSNLRCLSVVAGLLLVCAAIPQAFAASEVRQSSVPNFSSADLPWSPMGPVRPPANGLGPVGTVSSDIIRRELVNGNGDI